MRTVISAAAAYAGANGGFYDTLDCLAEPSRCIPGYPVTAPTFLDPHLASLAAKSGYRRSFHAGPPAPPDDVRRLKASRSSLTSFAYVAVPSVPPRGSGGSAGTRSGRMCFTADGATPPVKDGLCGEPCTDRR